MPIVARDPAEAQRLDSALGEWRGGCKQIEANRALSAPTRDFQAPREGSLTKPSQTSPQPANFRGPSVAALQAGTVVRWINLGTYDQFAH